MKAYDFSYNGVRLSDLGYMICRFDSGGIDTVSVGSEISFNTIPTLNGIKHELTSSSYEDCLSFTLQICKNQCDRNDDLEISVDEFRDLMRWLNQKNFYKFRIINDEYTGIYFEASFNVSKVEADGKIIGLELEAVTNRPFAVQDPVIMKFDNSTPNVVRSFNSVSDESGFIYPDMKIEIKQDGDLTINSITEGRNTVIKGCKAGEIITIDHPVIKSSDAKHKVQNDFNWVFYRVSTTFKDTKNKFTASLPCIITMTYSPIAKVGL